MLPSQEDKEIKSNAGVEDFILFPNMWPDICTALHGERGTGTPLIHKRTIDVNKKSTPPLLL